MLFFKNFEIFVNLALIIHFMKQLGKLNLTV